MFSKAFVRSKEGRTKGEGKRKEMKEKKEDKYDKDMRNYVARNVDCFVFRSD